MKKKMIMLAVALSATTFQFGCGGGGGGNGGGGLWYNVTRFLGDVIATNLVLTNVD